MWLEFAALGVARTPEENRADCAAQNGDALILIARHGETELNAAGQIIGQRDPPLNARGLQQAQALAESLDTMAIAAVWTSPLRRAVATADAICERRNLIPTILPDLIESGRGGWEGEQASRLALAEPDSFNAFVRGDDDFTFPGGESLQDQRLRTATALQTVARGSLPALVVAHAGTIRAALAVGGGNATLPESAFAHGQVAVRYV